MTLRKFLLFFKQIKNEYSQNLFNSCTNYYTYIGLLKYMDKFI